MLAKRLGWHSSGILDLVSGAPIQLQQQLKFQIQKSPIISGEASLCWRSGWAGIPAGLSTPCQVHQYNSNNGLKFQIQKSPVISDEASLCWRSGWAGIPAGLSTPCQVHQYNSNNSLKFQIQKSPVISDEASLYWRSGRDSNPRPPA